MLRLAATGAADATARGFGALAAGSATSAKIRGSGALGLGLGLFEAPFGRPLPLGSGGGGGSGASGSGAWASASGASSGCKAFSAMMSIYFNRNIIESAIDRPFMSTVVPFPSVRRKFNVCSC
jgi:hypothetical protein